MSAPTGPANSAGEAWAGQLLRRAGQIERAITFVAFLVLVGVLFADVLSRELTGTGLAWARQAGIYANLFITVVGIGVASAGGTHLRPRFADGWLPASWTPTLERLQEGVMALFFLGLAGFAALAVAETRLLEERTANPRLLVWPFQAVLPLAFLVAGLRHSLYAAFPGLRPREPGPGRIGPEPAAGAVGSG